VNGTCNHILTTMTREAAASTTCWPSAAARPREADPTTDVDGIDAAHKLTLLAAMAFGAELTFKDIPTEGIRGIEPIDFDAARELGYRIKLLAIAKGAPRSRRESIRR
jgi:homoserine dehydrogenase